MAAQAVDNDKPLPAPAPKAKKAKHAALERFVPELRILEEFPHHGLKAAWLFLDRDDQRIVSSLRPHDRGTGDRVDERPANVFE